MKSIHLYITAFLLLIFASCKTQNSTQIESSAENEIPALELIQSPVKLDQLYGKKLYWVQNIFPQKKNLKSEQKSTFIVFSKDGSLAIQSLCNTGRGQFKTSHQNINITAELTSRIACKESELEFQFFEGLRSTHSIYQTGNKIFFKTKGYSVLMEFELSK